MGLDSTRFARRYLGYLVLDFFSWRYWDVSIPSVCFHNLLHSAMDYRILLLQGFPIRTCTGQRSIGSSPYSFVALTVLLRQHVPRHPPRALSRLSFALFYLWVSLKRSTLLLERFLFLSTLRLFADHWNSQISLCVCQFNQIFFVFLILHFLRFVESENDFFSSLKKTFLSFWERAFSSSPSKNLLSNFLFHESVILLIEQLPALCADHTLYNEHLLFCFQRSLI